MEFVALCMPLKTPGGKRYSFRTTILLLSQLRIRVVMHVMKRASYERWYRKVPLLHGVVSLRLTWDQKR